MAQKKKKTPLLSLKSKGVSITGKSLLGSHAGVSKNGKTTAPLGGSAPGMLPSKQTRRIIRTHHTLLKQQAIIQKDIEKEMARLNQEQREAQKSKSKSKEDAPDLPSTSEKLEELQQSLGSVAEKIKDNGGILVYQQASIAGQDNSRGGDTSKIMIDWLQELGIVGQKTKQRRSKKNDNESTDIHTNTTISSSTLKERGKQLSLLEVGSLSANNACSAPGIFDYIERIDLNSQDPDNIKEQDFMKRPLPKRATVDNGTKTEPEFFNIISLSLVVNYVSDPQTRGRMLLRTTEFLKKLFKPRNLPVPNKTHRRFDDTENDTEAKKKQQEKEAEEGKLNAQLDAVFPCLFLVLPAPCVTNSRYLTETHLTEIMNAIGYTTLLKHKVTNKLVYYLWRYGDPLEEDVAPPKLSPYIQKELNHLRNPSPFENPTKSDSIKRQEKKMFPKREVNPGGGRNNFAITL